MGERAFELKSPDDLEKLCAELRKVVASAEGGCTFNSWYMRISPERLLDILREAYSAYLRGEISVGAVLERYLQAQGLSKSLARTITPTFSALGLSTSGAFSKTALEVGRALYGGSRAEALAALRAAAKRNCVLRDIMERMRGCEGGLAALVEEVLRSYGKPPRADEIRYTADLVKLLHPACAPCDFNCADKEALAACADAVVDAVMSNIADLFEKLDISIQPAHLSYVKDGAAYRAMVRETNKPVGTVALADPIEGAQVGKLRDLSRSLDRLVEEGAYSFYIKIIPILEQVSHCQKVKAFVEVIRSDLERASKVLKLA